MLNVFKKYHVDTLCSPIIGKSIPLDNVPDMVFANKLMGDGIAFEFDGDTVYAPCDGEIIMIAGTNHAMGLKTKNGMEIMLHVGMDTVNLNGNGLKVLVSQYDKVKAKDKLIEIDRKLMEEKKMNLVTPLVVTNANDYELLIAPFSEVNLESIVLRSKKK